ncbi:putative ribonuclease H-like domain-containing protein [Tanacetum coccineum]
MLKEAKVEDDIRRKQRAETVFGNSFLRKKVTIDAIPLAVKSLNKIIRHSNARTPQQNGVAERKNRTLIEAARTMLADSKLPTMFWTEAVSTACYVLNRVLVTKPHNKTPYELVSGKVPNISHLKPFGCLVTILNTSDHLGKFEGKADEGFIVGYAAHSKAYRVYNLSSKKIEETLNLRYLEDKPNVQGLGHEWYFDLDYLTDSLGYTRFKTNQPAGTHNTNIHAGTQDDSDSECDEQVIVVPSFPSNSFSGPKDHAVSELVESSSDYAEELARLQKQAYEANATAEKHLSPADLAASRNRVPAGKVVPAADVSVGHSQTSTPVCPPVHTAAPSFPPGHYIGRNPSVVVGVCSSLLIEACYTSNSSITDTWWDLHFNLFRLESKLLQEDDASVLVIESMEACTLSPKGKFAIDTKLDSEEQQEMQSSVVRNKDRRSVCYSTLDLKISFTNAHGYREEGTIDKTLFIEGIPEGFSLLVQLKGLLFQFAASACYRHQLTFAFNLNAVKKILYVDFLAVQKTNHCGYLFTEAEYVAAANCCGQLVCLLVREFLLVALNVSTGRTVPAGFVVVAYRRPLRLLQPWCVLEGDAGWRGDEDGSSVGGCDEVVDSPENMDVPEINGVNVSQASDLKSSQWCLGVCWKIGKRSWFYLVGSNEDDIHSREVPLLLEVEPPCCEKIIRQREEDKVHVPGLSAVVRSLKRQGADLDQPDSKKSKIHSKLKDFCSAAIQDPYICWCYTLMWKNHWDQEKVSSSEVDLLLEEAISAKSVFVIPSRSTIPIEDEDPDAENKRCIKYASDTNSDSDDDTPVNLMDTEATGVGLVLWGDLKVLIDSPEVNDGSDVWKNQNTWIIQSWKLYSSTGIHVLETVSGIVLHMFVDKRYPLSVNLIERMLEHQLEICRDTVGNELTTAVQLIVFLKKQISDSRRPKFLVSDRFQSSTFVLEIRAARGGMVYKCSCSILGAFHRKDLSRITERLTMSNSSLGELVRNLCNRLSYYIVGIKIYLGVDLQVVSEPGESLSRFEVMMSLRNEEINAKAVSFQNFRGNLNSKIDVKGGSSYDSRGTSAPTHSAL